MSEDERDTWSGSEAEPASTWPIPTPGMPGPAGAGALRKATARPSARRGAKPKPTATRKKTTAKPKPTATRKKTTAKPKPSATRKKTSPAAPKKPTTRKKTTATKKTATRKKTTRGRR